MRRIAIENEDNALGYYDDTKLSNLKLRLDELESDVGDNIIAYRYKSPSVRFMAIASFEGAILHGIRVDKAHKIVYFDMEFNEDNNIFYKGKTRYELGITCQNMYGSEYDDLNGLYPIKIISGKCKIDAYTAITMVGKPLVSINCKEIQFGINGIDVCIEPSF